MWVLVLVALQACPLVRTATTSPFTLESNLVLPLVQQRRSHPEPKALCDGNSICSFLQANSKGVNVVSYCQCSHGSQCSTQWDPYDGKSITQSQSDQYKYCHSAPPVRHCDSKDQVAYSSLQVFKGETKIHSRDEIHCVCPDGHNYLDTRYDFREEGDRSEVLVDYFCLPLAPCNQTQHCKDVTIKPGEYIVNPKCLCPEGLACPSVTNKGVTTIRLGQTMELQQVTCQLPDTGPAHPLSSLFVPNALSELYRKQWPVNKKKKYRPYKRSDPRLYETLSTNKLMWKK